MEAASESKKRGRPNVYAQAGMDDIRDQIIKDKGSRAAQNEFYIMDAITAIERLSPKGRERIYFVPDGLLAMTTQEAKRAGYKRDSTILEQLGRVLIQDKLSDADFVLLAEKAAVFKEQGYASKEIAKWIRSVRTEVKATIE